MPKAWTWWVKGTLYILNLISLVLRLRVSNDSVPVPFVLLLFAIHVQRFDFSHTGYGGEPKLPREAFC